MHPCQREADLAGRGDNDCAVDPVPHVGDTIGVDPQVPRHASLPAGDRLRGHRVGVVIEGRPARLTQPDEHVVYVPPGGVCNRR